jgi:hypothetical protein
MVIPIHPGLAEIAKAAQGRGTRVTMEIQVLAQQR